MSRVPVSCSAVAEKRVDFAYNAAGQFTAVNRFNDTDGGPTHEIVSAVYDRDDIGRLTSLTYNQDSSPLLDAYVWTYDPISRVTSFDSRDGLQEYQYDLTSQLKTVEIDSFQTEDYGYDENGNRTNTGYVTGDNNQLLQDGTYTYTYDDEGNRLTRVLTSNPTGEVTDYKWDYRNRLSEVVTWDQLRPHHEVADRRLHV